MSTPKIAQYIFVPFHLNIPSKHAKVQGVRYTSLIDIYFEQIIFVKTFVSVNNSKENPDMSQIK